jgi:hypothetical protein
MKLQLHSLALVPGLSFLVQAGQNLRTLEPGKAVEREIAGGESHTYQINLAARQFARFRLEQRVLDVVLLTAPDGKQLVEMNLTEAGEEESLSLEALTRRQLPTNSAPRQSRDLARSIPSRSGGAGDDLGSGQQTAGSRSAAGRSQGTQ